MFVKVITSITDLKNTEAFWNKLSDYCTVFNLHGWFKCWFSSYGRDKQLRVYIAENSQNNECAILPLMKYKKDNVVYLVQLAEKDTDYFSVIVNNDNDAIEAIFRYIKDNETYDRFIISNLKVGKQSTELLFKSAMSVFNDIEVVVQGKTFYIDTLGNYEKYISSRSKNFRHKYNQLKKFDDIFSFESIDTYSKSIVNEIIKIHIKRWLKEMQLSVFADKRRRDFFHLILNEYSKLGIMRIFILKDKDVIVSYRVGFVYKGTYYDWNTAFNLDYASKSVGMILCNKIVEYCFEHDIVKFDFMRGEEDYKKNFSTGTEKYMAFEFKRVIELENYVYIPPRQKIRNNMKQVKTIIWAVSKIKPIQNLTILKEFVKHRGIHIIALNDVENQKEIADFSQTMIIGDILEDIMKFSEKYGTYSCLLINELEEYTITGKPDIVVDNLNELFDIWV